MTFFFFLKGNPCERLINTEVLIIHGIHNKILQRSVVRLNGSTTWFIKKVILYEHFAYTTFRSKLKLYFRLYMAGQRDCLADATCNKLPSVPEIKCLIDPE